MSNTTAESTTLNNTPQKYGEKTSLLEKLSFSLVTFGGIAAPTVLNAGLLMFYTDVVGLDPAKVGILFLIARIWDGVNDPVQGFIIDHLPKTKMGRFRPYLIIGSFLFTINYLLIFFGPLRFSGAAQLAVVWITYLSLDVVSCLMTIPNDCLLPVMTDNPKDRNILFQFKGAAVTLANFAGALPLPILLDAMQDDKLKAFSIAVGLCAALTVTAVPLGTLGVKERIPAAEEQKYSLRDLFPILTQRPVYALFLAYLLINISNAAAGGSFLFFFDYVMDDRKLPAVISAVQTVAALPTIPLLPLVATRYGKRFSFTSGMLTMFGAGMLRLVNIYNKPLLFVSSALTAIGSSFAHPLAYGIMADNMDYVEYAMDKRAEGAVASLNTFIGKASAGIGGAMSGYILDWTGYVPNEKNQTQRAKNGITFMSVIFPTIACLAAALFFRFLYPLTNARMQEITAELHERRAAREKIEAEISAETSPSAT